LLCYVNVYVYVWFVLFSVLFALPSRNYFVFSLLLEWSSVLFWYPNLLNTNYIMIIVCTCNDDDDGNNINLMACYSFTTCNLFLSECTVVCCLLIREY